VIPAAPQRLVTHPGIQTNTGLEQEMGSPPVPHPTPDMENGQPVLRFPDGSVMAATAPFPHNGNLAEILSPAELNSLGMSLKELIEEDLESQQPYFDGVMQTVEELGLIPGAEAVDGTGQIGSTDFVNSTALLDALFNIAALARQNLYKANDMVDTRIVGTPSMQSFEVAERKKLFFNYYLTYISKEFRKESVRTIIWSAIAGSIYKKVYIDPVLGRPTSIFIPVKDFIVNRAHATHHASMRKTHRLRLSNHELQVRRVQGIYRDVPIMPEESGEAENDELQDLLNSIAGYEEVYNRNERDFVIYETHVQMRINGDPASKETPLALPYIISLDADSGTVLGVYRNWRQDDPTYKAIDYFVNFPFFPSLDGEGYGFSNYAARLSRAATMITRQLLTSAQFANFPGGFVQGGMRLQSSTFSPSPSEFITLNSPTGKLNEAIMPLPYREPSPTLDAMRKEIEDSIRRPCMIMNDKVMDIAPRAPQGTVLFMLEQMHKVPTALLQTLYEAFSEELELLNQRLYEWLPPNQSYPFSVNGGSHVIMKNDFAPGIQVYPSVDPSLPNSSYRMLQSELLLQTAQKYPEQHNTNAVLTYYYENMGLGPDEIQGFLVPPPSPPPPVPALDPVTENTHILTAAPVNASIDQDHDAHIIVHSQLLNHPDPTVGAAAQAHIKQHEAFKFTVQIYSALHMQPPSDPNQLPIAQQNQIAMMAAQVVQQQNHAKSAQSGPTMEQLKMHEVEARNKQHERDAQIKLAQIRLEYDRLRQESQEEAAILAEKESANQLRLQLEQLKFEHEKELKEVELRMKVQEMELKRLEDMRKQDKHLMELHTIHTNKEKDNEG